MEPLGDEVRRELGRFGAQGTMGETVDAWPDAVGPEIARSAWPARFTREGTLVVHTRDSIWAFELTQRAVEIRKRLDVKGLKFVPGHLPEPSAEEASSQATTPAAASPEQHRQADEWAKEIANDELRKLVQKAAAQSLARATNDRSF